MQEALLAALFKPVIELHDGWRFVVWDRWKLAHQHVVLQIGFQILGEQDELLGQCQLLLGYHAM